MAWVGDEAFADTTLKLANVVPKRTMNTALRMPNRRDLVCAIAARLSNSTDIESDNLTDATHQRDLLLAPLASDAYTSSGLRPSPYLMKGPSPPSRGSAVRAGVWEAGDRMP